MQIKSVTYAKVPTSCESCGHDIRVRYVVELDTGSTIIVGSECAKTMLNFSTEPLTRYAAAAEREWRAKKPAPHEGEDRADYINRRIQEKAHAQRAWQMWRGLESYGDYGWKGHQYTVRKRLAARGIHDPYRYGGTFHDEFGRNNCTPGVRRECQRCQEYERRKSEYQREVDVEYEAMLREVETTCGANRWDFANRPAWRVA